MYRHFPVKKLCFVSGLKYVILQCQSQHPDDSYNNEGKINATLPKDVDPTSVDLETAMMLISEKSKKGTTKKKKRKKS